MSSNPATVHLWTRQQYEHMVAANIFDDNTHVELLDGYIVEMSPQSSLHAAAVYLVLETLQPIYQLGYMVRPQLPLALDDNSEPEPDIAVVKGNPRDFLDTHPTSAELIVEIASSSLQQDQTLKKSLYARNSIQEYWIVNLVTDCVEVYRQPAGEDYQFQTTLKRGDSVQVLAQPNAQIQVVELLP